MDLFDDRLYYCHSCDCRIIFCLLLRLDWNAWIIPSHAIHRLSDRVFFLIFNLCNPMVQVSNAKILRFLKMYGPRFFHISLHFWSTINIAMCFLVFWKRCVFGWLLWYPYFFFLGCPMMNAMIKISRSDLVILLLLEHWILLQCGCTYSF